MPRPRGSDDATLEVEEQVEALGDPETSPALPSGAIATAAAPHARRDRRRTTDREIWSLAWPEILSQSLASFVGLADIAMVGRLSRDAVAAVGYATQYIWPVSYTHLTLPTICSV